MKITEMKIRKTLHWLWRRDDCDSNSICTAGNSNCVDPTEVVVIASSDSDDNTSKAAEQELHCGKRSTYNELKILLWRETKFQICTRSYLLMHNTFIKQQLKFRTNNPIVRLLR